MTAIVALCIGVVGAVMLVVAQFLRRRASSMTDRGTPELAALHAEVRDTLDRAGWVASVKIYRRRTGVGLLEAYQAVDRIAHDETRGRGSTR
ncbi:hypothetical protein [Micromonospora sp. NPDC003241]